MKAKYSALTFLLFLIISCSPKFKTVVSNPQNPLSPSDVVVVLTETDDFENDGIFIGTLKAGDTGFTKDCNYYEIIDDLKAQARSNGANVIRITEHKVPDRKSTCDRISAELYRVPNFRKHEKLIDWTASRKLVWEDFKAEPYGPKKEEYAAATNCGFGYRTNYISFISKPKVFVYNQFETGKSWVRADQQHRPELLAHEQFHFDLCEVYTRRLRKRYSEVKIRSANAKEVITEIFQEVWSAYMAEQEKYDNETSHGLDSTAQKFWQDKIQNELKALASFTKK